MNNYRLSSVKRVSTGFPICHLVSHWQDLHWCLTKMRFVHCLQVCFVSRLSSCVLQNEQFFILFLLPFFYFGICYPCVLPTYCSSMASGEEKFTDNLQTYLLSRDHSNLKSEFQSGNGKVWLNYNLLSLFWVRMCSFIIRLLMLQKFVDSIEGHPAVEVVLGEHVFLSVGDYYLATKSD